MLRAPIFALCLLPFAATLCARAQDAKATASQVEHGHALFLADGCSACHGTVGQGSRASGPRIAPQTLPLENFVQVLGHPINAMPPYTVKVLSDADARAIHAYLESIPDPAHKVGDIPALNH